MKNIKVFKHRIYAYDEMRKGHYPVDEATTWEEALRMYEAHKQYSIDVQIVSKHFEQAVLQ